LIIGPRRLALIAAIAAVALLIIFYPLIVYTPIDVDQVEIQLTSVILGEESDEQELVLRPTFTVTNNNPMTLTTSRIDYDLFADGDLVTSNTLSYEDVPVNGRPAFFPNSSVPLRDSLTLQYADERAEIYSKILDNSTEIAWSVRGSATIESGTTFVPKTFESELPG
jgi:hypothetical protein